MLEPWSPEVREYLLEVCLCELEPLTSDSLCFKKLVQSLLGNRVPRELNLLQYLAEGVHILELLEPVLHIVGLAYLVDIPEPHDVDESGLLHNIHDGRVPLFFLSDSHNGTPLPRFTTPPFIPQLLI